MIGNDHWFRRNLKNTYLCVSNIFLNRPPLVIKDFLKISECFFRKFKLRLHINIRKKLINSLIIENLKGL